MEMKGIHGPSRNQLTLQFNPINWSKHIHDHNESGGNAYSLEQADVINQWLRQELVTMFPLQEKGFKPWINNTKTVNKNKTKNK